MEYLARSIDSYIEGLLKAFPAVMINGPRGSGKTTSMKRMCSSTLDLLDKNLVVAARDDPDGLLSRYREFPLLIDEWQEAPELLVSVKRVLDSDIKNEPNKFVLTGSVRAKRKSDTWPGTGRLIRLKMYGLTQAEINSNPNYNIIDSLFDGDQAEFSVSKVKKTDYFDLILRGRFPNVISLDENQRDIWFQSYIEQLIERDAPQLYNSQNFETKLNAVLASVGARTSLITKYEAIAQDTQTDPRTVSNYIDLLEDLSIIFRVPTWHNNRLKRLTLSPKIHLSDAGLAAHLRSVDVDTLIEKPDHAGSLVETFVAAELKSLIQTCKKRTELFHIRTNKQQEIDLILERKNKVIGIEIKASRSINSGSAKHLVWLKNQLGETFHSGIVLYMGDLPRKLVGDDIYALPISTLWKK